MSNGSPKTLTKSGGTVASKYYDVLFGQYKGSTRYGVLHPRFNREIVVAAPDEYAAMMAAANYWGQEWTDYTFYAYCDTRKL